MAKTTKISKALDKIQDALEDGKMIDKSAKVIPPDEYLKQKVPFQAFKDNDKYKDDIVVIINGKTWVIQRGKHVMIPRYVKHVIENSERQKVHSANHNQSLMDIYVQKADRLT